MLQGYGKFIVCKAVFEEKKGSLILTNDEKKPLYYEVISIGEEVCDLVGGDKMLVKQHCCYEFKHNGEDFLVISEDAVLALIED